MWRWLINGSDHLAEVKRTPQYQAAVAFGCGSLPLWFWIWASEVVGPPGAAKAVAVVMAPLCAFLPVLVPFDLWVRWQRFTGRI